MLKATDAKFYATQTRWESDNSIDVSELVSMLGRNIGGGARTI